VVVEADDMRAERVVATVAAVGEGERRLSCIWSTGTWHKGVDDPMTWAGELSLIFSYYSLLIGATALRVEWAKSMAQANQWEEDVVLLNKEMCRMLKFCEWKADWWVRQVPLRKDVTKPLAEGLKAYTAEQADMEWWIHKAWLIKWCHAQELAQPIIMAIMGEASLPIKDMEAGSMEFEIEEKHGGIEGDSDFEE
jgi:hypothetical protein